MKSSDKKCVLCGIDLIHYAVVEIDTDSTLFLCRACAKKLLSDLLIRDKESINDALARLKG